MAAVTYSAVKYDPMYCLNEHLEYFNENVVGDKNFLEADFDEIFGKDFMANIINDDSLSTPVKESVPSSPIMAPASPKSVMTAEDISRQANVVSPTTVATPTFSEESVRKIEKQKPKASRKRTISETSSEASSSTPKDQEDVRRERNRQHAKRSRQRKREFLNTLEQSVREIKAENQRLFDILGVNASDATTAMVNKEENKKAESIERFMDALKQPQNRVLDDTALASLRELFH